MNYHDKTKEELIEELQELQQQYDSVKTSYEKDFTECKKTEEALRVSEDRYRDLVENSQELVCIHDLEGRILSVNPWAAKVLGYEMDAILKMNICDFLAPEVRRGVQVYLARIRKNGTAKGLLQVQTAAGERRIWEYNNTLRTEGIAIPIVRGMAHDITDRKRAEEMLKASETKYKMIFNNAPIGIAISTIEGEIIDINKAQAEMIGYTIEELKGRYVSEYYAYPDKRMGMIKLFKKTGKVRDFEMEFNKKDGSKIIKLLNLDQVKIGGKDCLFATGRDITRQKQEEDALRQSEIKLKTLFDILPIGISILDAERNMVFINPALERILSMAKDGFIKGDYKSRKYIRPDGTQMPEEEYASVRAIREQRTIHNVETGVVMEDGNVIWTNVTAAPVAFPDWKVVIITTDISQRKQAEVALYESEERFRQLYQQAPLGYQSLDAEGYFIDVNQAWLDLLQYSRDEVIGRWFGDFLATQEVDAFKQRFTHFKATGEVHVDLEIVQHNGSKIIVHIDGKTAHDEHGKFKQTHCILYDITERKKAEEELYLEKENFRHSLDDSPLGVRIATIEGNTIYANKTLLDFYGYDSLGELQKTLFKDRYTPESYAQAQKRKHQRERGDLSDSEYEISIIRKNGEIRHLQVFRREVLWDGLRQFQVICNDITERKFAEETLHESEERFRRLSHGLFEGIIIHDEGKIIDANEAFAAMSGYDLSELIGKNALDFATPELREIAERNIHTGSEEPYEGMSLRKEGSMLYVEVRSKNIPYKGRMVRVTALMDITERKRAEEALRMEKENFRHSLDDSPLGVRIATKEGNTIYANKALLDFYGYDNLEELQNTPLKKRYTPGSYKQAQERKRQRKQGDFRSTDYEVSIVRENGEIRHLQAWRKEILWDGIRQFQVIYNDITQRKHGEEEIRKSKKLLEDLHKHLNEIRENERALISREIHDQIGQSLTALKLDMNWMTGYIKNTSPEAAAKLQGMIELISNTIKDVQRISSDLRPGILDDLGLATAIEWYCNEFETRTGIRCSLKLDNSTFDDSQKNLVFFRVLQEALTNVIRHANASSVSIILHQSKQRITLTIHDNGIGIPEEKIESYKSLGLINMRERVRQFSGKFVVSAKEGKGTKLTFFIPK